MGINWLMKLGRILLLLSIFQETIEIYENSYFDVSLYKKLLIPNSWPKDFLNRQGSDGDEKTCFCFRPIWQKLDANAKKNKM